MDDLKFDIKVVVSLGVSVLVRLYCSLGATLLQAANIEGTQTAQISDLSHEISLYFLYFVCLFFFCVHRQTTHIFVPPQ